MAKKPARVDKHVKKTVSEQGAPVFLRENISKEDESKSEAMRKFEQYEKMEQEQNDDIITGFFNIKKHIKKIKETHRRRKIIKYNKRLAKAENPEHKKERLKRFKKMPALTKAIRYEPTKEDGLTQEQVDARMREGYYNVIKTKTTKSYKRIFFSNIFTFFNLICVIVVAALIWAGAYFQIFFAAVFILNSALVIFQEIRSKLTVEKISLLTAPTANAIRDGKQVEIAIDKIVLDDVLVFMLGKQVCADSIVLSGEVEVNEALLTGESVPVKKKVGDLLYAGSFISSGKCIARVDKIGDYNYSSTLVSKAQSFKKKRSELLRSIQAIIRVIAVIIIPVAILMYFNNASIIGTQIPDKPIGELYTIKDVISKTAGAIVLMIPAGMYLLTTLALAFGVIKLVRKKALVQDLYSIEMLSRTNVICLDKTGTITDGTMKVNSVIQVSNSDEMTLHDIIGSMLTSIGDNNSTSQALGEHFGYSMELKATTILPFSSTRKMSGATFDMKGGSKTYIIGAPEFVLKNKDLYVEKTVKQFAGKGFRVLVLASAKGKIDGSKIPANLSCVAIIVIEDRIRENAEKTLKWFVDNGVEIKVISGDNAITVSEVSKRVGVPNADKFISLEGMTKQQVVEAASKYAVFGRVSPDQKSILVRALKAEGKKVAMTGDGVNDILALKEADCSIAMASGSEAARNVSQVVLLDSNFSSMPNIVAEGRRVINNISKSSALFLMKTIFAIMLAVFVIISRMTYPFTTLHYLLMDVFVVGIASFFLALQPNNEPIKGKFMYNLFSKALPAGILLFAGFLGCYIWYKAPGSGISEDTMQTMAAFCLTFTGITILFRICRPFDVFKTVLMLFVVIAVSLFIALMPGFFGFVDLSTVQTMAVVVFVETSYLLYNGVVRMTDALMYFLYKLRSSAYWKTGSTNSNYYYNYRSKKAEDADTIEATPEFKEDIKSGEINISEHPIEMPIKTKAEPKKKDKKSK